MNWRTKRPTAVAFLGQWRTTLSPPDSGVHEEHSTRLRQCGLATLERSQSPTRGIGKPLGLAEPRGMRPLVAHCHLGLGKLHRRTGKREQAREHLTTAATMYRERGMTYWL